MTRNLVVLADGTEVFSGGVGSAVMAVTLTECVNTGKELAPGAVCAAMAELTLLDLGELRKHVSPEMLIGTLAHSAGIIDQPVGLSARELAQEFSWEKVRGESIYLDSAALTRG